MKYSCVIVFYMYGFDDRTSARDTKSGEWKKRKREYKGGRREVEEKNRKIL